MDETDIQKLFTEAIEYPQQDTGPGRKVFSTLIRSTLEYRDDLKASSGVVVTVEDVRACLNWLVPAMATGNMPETDNEIRLGLLKIWLKELRNAESP